MYTLSYEKCICFIFLVILAFLSCSGSHIDKMITLPYNKKFPFTSTSSNNENYVYNSDFVNSNQQMMENRKFYQRGDIRGVHREHLTGLLPLEELQRMYERRRKRRIRTTRLQTAAERRTDSVKTTDVKPQVRIDRSSNNTQENHPPIQQNDLTRTKRLAPTPQKSRRGGKGRFCPGQDVATRAFLAKTVLEGKIRSKTKTLSPRSNYNVTYEVKTILKDQPGFRTFGKNESIRLQFANERGKTGDCDTKLVNGVVAAQLNISKNYVLFADRIGDHEYKILGPPVEATKKNLQEIQKILALKKVKAPKFVPGLKGMSLKTGKKLRLVCKTRGNPPPNVHWYKDGREIQGPSSRKIRIQHKKRRTVLLIPKVEPEDAGKYECRAFSVVGPSVSTFADIKIQPRPTPKSESGPEGSSPCADQYKGFCLNGGSCLFFETVGEYACKCAEGYTGQRCESKDVTNTSSMYRQSSHCKLGLHSSYYC